VSDTADAIDKWDLPRPELDRKSADMLDWRDLTASGGLPEASEPTTPEPPKAEWFCEQCDQVVQPEHVTYDERHDERASGCGLPVGSRWIKRGPEVQR